MNKYVIAPDSFKGTISSQEVCDIIERSILDFDHDAVIVKVPVSDGGEGFADAFLRQCGGTRHELSVKGPLFQPVQAYWGMLADNKTAVIEMAAAAGLMLIKPEQMNPELTTTWGVGELILDAISKGAEKIIIGLGGSATNDGGIGMATALGYRFLDASGEELSPIGANLSKIARIIKPPDQIRTDFEAACDVNNTLFGPDGAAFVFAGQKGADQAMIERLDEGLKNLTSKIESDLGAYVGDVSGGGAAGGLGAAVVAFLGGTLKPGIELLLDTMNFDALIQDADYLFTGEGRMDGQSLAGKTPVGVARRGKQLGVPVIGIAGSLSQDLSPFYAEGFTALFSTIRDVDSVEATLAHCREDLYATVRAVVSLILAGQKNITANLPVKQKSQATLFTTLKKFISETEALVPVDASKFKDPLALQVAWTGLKTNNPGSSTKVLVETEPGVLRYKSSVVEKLKATLFAGSAVVFDKHLGLFYRGLKPTSDVKQAVRLEDIHALQLLSRKGAVRSNENKANDFLHVYELNLVKHDGVRHHVMSYYDKNNARADAAVISEWLAVPVWDGIDG